MFFYQCRTRAAGDFMDKTVAVTSHEEAGPSRTEQLAPVQDKLMGQLQPLPASSGRQAGM